MNDRQKNLFRQLESYRGEVLHAIENVTEEEAEIVPKYSRNNIRWQLGHLYLDQYLWIKALTKEDIQASPAFAASFGYGTAPEDFTEETPSFSELKELLRQQPAEILKRYGSFLDKEYPPTEMNMNTIEQVLIRTIFHEGMHLQAINDIKKHLIALKEPAK